MNEVICEFWCSPLRQEIYSKSFIIPNATDGQWLIDEINESYADTIGDFWFDVFGEDYQSIGGLFKVVLKITVEFSDTIDWEGIPDTRVDFSSEVLFKSKCYSFCELKWKWLELQGPERLERYIDVVLMRECK